MSNVSALVKTYPIKRPDGSLLAFEITSAWVTFRSMFRILRSVEGVTNVRRKWFNEDHATFLYLGEPCIIWEPWGDSDRYWVGPKEAATSKLEITPVHTAFQQHKGALERLWSVVRAQRDA